MRELPPILRGDALQQIAELRDYLVRVGRDADTATVETVVSEAPRIIKDAAKNSGSGSGSGSGKTASDALARAAQLRALIVKTAENSRNRDNVLMESIGDLGHEMRQSYLAKSEFGRYQQEILLIIDATARQIVESYGYLEQIQATQAELGEMGREIAAYELEISGQIRRGFLEDPDTHQTVLGIAISQQLQFTGRELTDGGWNYYELSPGQTLGLYTSTGWQFWVNGRKVGWFDSSDGMLHTVSQVVEQEIRMGDWVFSRNGGLGIKYMGSSTWDQVRRKRGTHIGLRPLPTRGGSERRPLSVASRQQQSWEHRTLPARWDSPTRGEPRGKVISHRLAAGSPYRQGGLQGKEN